MSSVPDAVAAGVGAPIRLAVLLFNGFEPLDFVGPVNIFGAVGKWPPQQPGGAPRLPGVEVLYVAQERGPLTSVTGTLTVVANHSFADLPPPWAAAVGGGGSGGDSGDSGGNEEPAAAGAGQQQHQPQAQPLPPPQQPRLDWLLVPGGVGTRKEVHNAALLSWVSGWCAPGSGLRLCMSVCTGAGLLAAAGVLDGRRATTNKVAFAFPEAAGPRVGWARRARWVRDGRFWTSSGVSAGADMAVAVLKAELGVDAAAAAAKYCEYVPATDADDDPFADDGFMPAV